MSRPLRIEYKNAYYHVMNRGAGYREIFRDDVHREMFIALLREIYEMFHVEIHAYCLMGNHYHLLLSTPKANLSRAMRHLNGVYTQRYNRLEKTDGALFRGRYRAILIDVDSYLLSVSRYIHLNPVEAEMVKNPSDYPWSSYCQFVGDRKVSPWLNVTQTLKMIGQRNVKKRYREFVEKAMDEGIDSETEKFYQESQSQAVFGSDEFIGSILKKVKEDSEIPESRLMKKTITMENVVTTVAKVFTVKEESILISCRGRGQKNLPRSISLYLSRKHAGIALNDIAKHFGLNHYGSVSGIIKRFEDQLNADASLMAKIKQILKIMNERG